MMSSPKVQQKTSVPGYHPSRRSYPPSRTRMRIAMQSRDFLTEELVRSKCGYSPGTWVHVHPGSRTSHCYSLLHEFNLSWA